MSLYERIEQVSTSLLAGLIATIGGGFQAVSYTGRGGGTYPGQAVVGLDHSSHAAFRADVAARFTPRAGGPLAGKVFLVA